MKKFLRRKKKASEQADALVSEPEESGLYDRQVSDEPLDEYADGYGRQIRRTSQHSPARRRENSNRASDREILFLLLRAGAVLAAVAIGFFALKFVLGRLSKPSEEQKQRWEQEAAMMEQGGQDAGPVVPEITVVGLSEIDEAFVQTKLSNWKVSERQVRSAEALERRGMLDQAAERLLQALSAAPQNRPAQRLLLKIYNQTQDYPAVVALCLRLLDQDSRDHEVKQHLLRALQKTGELQGAVLLGQDLLEDEPSDVAVLEIVAPAQEQLGMIDDALTSYDLILRQSPLSQSALEGLGRLNEQAGAWQEAIPYYLNLVKQDPLPEYYHALARCYAQLGEENKAVIFLGQASSLFGENEVSSWLGEALLDPIREGASFRSFADRVVGTEARKAIESIRQREAARQDQPAVDSGLNVPQTDLNAELNK